MYPLRLVVRVGPPSSDFNGKENLRSLLIREETSRLLFPFLNPPLFSWKRIKAWIF